MGFLVFLAGLSALNVWLSRRVWSAGPGLEHKGLLVLSIWLMPVLGAVLAVNHIRFHAPDPSSWLFGANRPDALRAEAPDEVHPPGLASFPLRDHLQHIEGGTPRLDWAAVNRWLEPVQDPNEQAQARKACQRAWLLHVRDALGPDYRLLIYPDVFILATLDAAEATSAFFTRAHTRIGEALHPLALPHAWGGHSILIIANGEGDWQSHLGGGGEGPTVFHGNHAAFVASGCPHFVVEKGDVQELEPMIAHELTRQALSYLYLPEWLTTGIALHTTRTVTGTTLETMSPHQLRHLHQQYWNENTIHEFWSGQAFDLDAEDSTLAFDLAQLLVELLGKDWSVFADFVAQASCEDAGARAASTQLGIELSDAVCALLGKTPSPEWQPRASRLT